MPFSVFFSLSLLYELPILPQLPELLQDVLLEHGMVNN